MPADEIISNGNHETSDYLSKSHKKKKKKHKHHKEKKKRARDDNITIHEEISLGEETLAEAPMSKRSVGLENTNRVTTNFNESQNCEWESNETTNPSENRQTLQQLLTHLLRALERRDPQRLFAWPVTDRIAPNYSRLISKPMDFETIRRNIQSNLYISLNAFVADFKLMCDNAMTYNQPETIYYKAAKRLLHAGLKLTGPEKLKTLLSALPGMANIPQSQLGFDINQDYQGDTSNDTIIENNEQLPDSDQSNQQKILSKFEAIPDNLTPEEIFKQAQNAAKMASQKLATKNTKIGFLKQQNNGSTSLSILVPNDGINPETGERPVLLGSLIGKLSHGVGSIPGFREDRRNMVKTVKPLYYGAFGSYAPTYDSTFANLTKEESDLILRTYGDEASAKYAESILNFTKDSDYAMTMADNLLDLMTGGDHRKTKRILDERKKQVILEDGKKPISQLKQPSSGLPLATSQANTGSSNTTPLNNQIKSTPIQIDQLKSLSELGIDTKFIDYYQEQSVFQDRLDHVGGLLGRLQSVQNQRLSAPLPQHLSQISHPSPQEIQLADKITESLTENLKRVPPSAVMSVTGVRKAMGIAQVSHLDVTQNNCHPSNLGNHGLSHQQTQVTLIGDGIQDRVEAVEGTVSGVDLESELREFLESDPTLTSFPLHDENDRTIEEILSES